MPSLNEIRTTFLDYFAKNEHKVVESSPLVPRSDPTLMFTNSGMVQFKNLFTGIETRDYKRATTSQKCVRAGGKHNDLDNVGYTARHLTFFEMLGNFSFGDYFKSEAIPFAWDLLVDGFGIDKNKLSVTVYHTDDEAYNIWKKIGVPEERIIPIATSDNFWQMGPTGPCGPSTEIFYDFGPEIWGGPPGSAEEDGDRFIEIWNIVFMQNEMFADGSTVPLEMQSIDTGMGLERFAALMQGTNNLFETDLMQALVEASAHATNTDTSDNFLTHHRVIADHLRSTSFLLAEGVMPSNEGRGYVLRRIMRRAMRHAHLLGAKDPIMHQLVPALIQQMGAAYPELSSAQLRIAQTLEDEERRFRQTLDRGLKLLESELQELPKQADLPGETAFKLYDTYGFPLDLTQDALREHGRGVDTDGFERAMAKQKAKARAAWSGTGESGASRLWFDVRDTAGPTEFLGYESETAEGQIAAIVVDGVQCDKVTGAAQIALNQTPFYAESGGQVGDRGEIITDTGRFTVTDTQKSADVIIHIGTVSSGHIAQGQAARLCVDHSRRRAIRANHSATHLLHEALREALGDHVAQRGSLNDSDRLRFDFSHGQALSTAEMRDVQQRVNHFIRQNDTVDTRLMTPDDARALGAQALFGEKYGDEVRVVSMGRAQTGKGTDGDTWSIELCGGTHVSRTGEIGAFVTLSDSASSAGIRRIEALTGQAALDHLAARDALLESAANALNVAPRDLPDRIASIMEERKNMTNELAQMRRDLAMGSNRSGPETEDVNGVAFLAQALDGVTGKDLPSLIDAHKENLGSAVIFLIANTGGKAAVAAGVSADLTARLNAVDLVRAATQALGGKGGGGRPDMAQGGAPSSENSQAAIDAARDVISQAFGE